MKILHINTRLNIGGSAHIMNTLSDLQKKHGHVVNIYAPQKMKYLFKIDRSFSVMPYLNFFIHKIFGFDYFTLNKYKLIRLIKKSDIVHLHVIHGYFINYNTLFKLIIKYNKPLCITLHDLWYFTGRCAIPIECEQLNNACSKCPNLNTYPGSILDNTHFHINNKLNLYSQIKNIAFVSPSKWLFQLSQNLTKNEIILINNGINIDRFDSELNSTSNKKFDLIFVTTDFNDKNKYDPIILKKFIDKGLNILLIGKNQTNFNRANVIQINKILDNSEVVKFMKQSNMFLILSKFENFPTVLIEAILSGCFILSTKNLGSIDILSNFFENDDYLFLNDINFDTINFTTINNNIPIKNRRISLARKIYNRTLMYNRYSEVYKNLVKYNII